MDITRPTTAQPGPTTNGSGPPIDPAISNDVNAFSWLDLGAVGDFALTNNDSMSGSLDSFDHLNDSPATFPIFDQNMMMPQYNWNGLSPSGVIF